MKKCEKRLENRWRRTKKRWNNCLLVTNSGRSGLLGCVASFLVGNGDSSREKPEKRGGARGTD